MSVKIIYPLLLATTLLQAQPRKDYAVFFPVSTYTGGWIQLPATVTECNDLANDLRNLYGFQTTVLPEKTKAEIKAQLADLANRSYGPEDQLLLVFSMHGYFDEAGDAGCLCPAGAKTNDGTFDTWLLHTEMRTLVARIPCEHILVVLDACYSGTFGGKKGKPDGEIYKETSDCQANIQQALSRKTRYYIAAGAKERVPAGSELIKRIRIAFGGRYSGEDRILSLKELLAAVSEARPTPKDGEFTGDLGGGFVFVPKDGCAPTAPTPAAAPDLKAWNYAKSQDTREAYEFYQANFENGRYRADAQRALDRLQEERIWQAAVQKGTPAAYDNYKAIYCPGGGHCAEAEEKAKTLPATPPVTPPAGNHDDAAASFTDPLVGTMILVKGGSFTMGCTGEQSNCTDHESPAHQVTLSNFYIGQTEVTQAQWRAVMGADPPELKFKGCGDCPVEGMRWEDIQQFLTKLNILSGRSWYRLPTEAEWEYAARGGRQSKKYLYAGGNKLKKVAWYSGSKTHPVKSKAANELGLYDMSGNVDEWCSDWYNSGYYKNSPSSNPTGPSSGSFRVRRGGSWDSDPRNCRVANRSCGASGLHYYTGFRLARTN